MRTSRLIPAVLVAGVAAVARGQAVAPPTDVTPPGASAAPTRDATATTTDPAPGTTRLSELNDFHFAAWVLIESDTINKVSRWEAQHGKSEQVKDFAREISAWNDQFATALRGPLTQGEGTPDEKFDFAAVLRGVTERLAENDQVDVTVTTTAPEEQRDVDVVEPPAGNSASATRRDDNDNDRRDRRRLTNLRDRRERDGRLREAADRFRDNLPGLVEEVSASMNALEDRNEETGLAFVDFKRQLGERYAASLIEEMERGPQQDVDPAYLGIMTAAHLQIIDTMTVAREHASPELQKTLDVQIAAARERLQTARKLMASSVSQESGPPQP